MKTFLLLMLVAVFSLPVFSQGETVLVADFNSGRKPTNLGEDFGNWDKDPNDRSQGCKMSFAKDDALGLEKGFAVQLDYDVDSSNPAYNGFWLKISKAQVTDFETISFYVKGDAAIGFTTKIKVELKDKKKGKATFSIENITEVWQKFTLTIDKRSYDSKQNKPFEEFVIVFDDTNSSPKTGRIFIDQIEFGKK